MTRIVRAGISKHPSCSASTRDLVAPRAGAVVGFGGIVRNHDGGREVLPSGILRPPARRADPLWRSSAESAAAPVQAVAASHRVGRLEIGEAATVAAVAVSIVPRPSRPARGSSTPSKERLPVWKQFFADDATSG